MNVVQLHHRCLDAIAACTLVVLPLTALAQPPSPNLVGEGGGGGRPVNAICPVMTDEPIDPRFTARYGGVTIGLCCRKCKTKFEADPTAYIANITEVSAVTRDDHADHDHDRPAEASPTQHESENHAHPDATSVHSPAPKSIRPHDDGHDHATDHDNGPKLVVWFGKLHPLATHLPIGLLFGATIAEILLIVTRREHFRHASAYCVGLGAIGAAVTATLGWFNGGFVLVDDDWVQLVHRWLGTITAVLTIVTGAFLLRTLRPGGEPVSRITFRVSLFVTTAFVGATGFFGGALIYGINHYAW